MHRYFEGYYDPRLRCFTNYDWRNEARSWLNTRLNAIPEFVDFAERLFDHYLTWQHNDKQEFNDLNLNFLSVEEPFNIPIRNRAGNASNKFSFAGKVDGVLRSWSDNKLYLHEIKTCKSIDQRIQQLQFEHQPTAYMLAMSEVYGEPIAGVIYTLIRKKLPAEPDVLNNGMLSKNKGIDTTADHYLKCVKDHHCERFDPDFSLFYYSDAKIKAEYGDILTELLNKPNPFFRRVLIKRSQAQLNEMRNMLYDVAREMTNPNTKPIPNPGFQCGNCVFQQPCIALSNGDNVQPILNAHYTRNTRLD